MTPEQMEARRVIVADEIRTGMERRVAENVPGGQVNTLLPGWSALIDSIAEAIVREVDRRIS